MSREGKPIHCACISHLLDTLGMPHPVDSDIDAVLQTSWANMVPVHHLVSPRCVLNPRRLEKMHGTETHGSSCMARILINAVPSRNKDPALAFPCEYRHTKSGSSSAVHSALQRYVGESLGSPASGQKLHTPSSGTAPPPALQSAGEWTRQLVDLEYDYCPSRPGQNGHM